MLKVCPTYTWTQVLRPRRHRKCETVFAA